MKKALKNWFLNSGSSYDSDAQAFFTAAGISDATQKTAVNTLVLAIKAASLWTGMKAIYPMVGGTGTTHKYNLKDPRDLDAAFRLNFQGGWTHSSNGALPNGTSGYADTFFVPSVQFSSNVGSLGYYSRTSTASDGYELGCSNGGDVPFTGIIARLTLDKYFPLLGSSSYTPLVTSTDGRGFFVATRMSGFNRNVGYKNGSQVGTADEAYLATSVSMYLGCSNLNGVATYFGNKQCAFAFIAAANLDATNNSDLYTAVQAFNTTLSRQV